MVSDCTNRATTITTILYHAWILGRAHACWSTGCRCSPIALCISTISWSTYPLGRDPVSVPVGKHFEKTRKNLGITSLLITLDTWSFTHFISWVNTEDGKSPPRETFTLGATTTSCTMLSSWAAAAACSICKFRSSKRALASWQAHQINAPTTDDH